MTAYAGFPDFLPYSFLIYFAILPTSFGGKEPYLRRWLVAQSSSDSPSWGFPRFYSATRQMPGDAHISLSPLSLVNWCEWRYVRASGQRPGTGTGAGGIATLACILFDRSPLLRGQQVLYRNIYFDLSLFLFLSQKKMTSANERKNVISAVSIITSVC